jgi:hypothetical protein
MYSLQWYHTARAIRVEDNGTMAWQNEHGQWLSYPADVQTRIRACVSVAPGPVNDSNNNTAPARGDNNPVPPIRPPRIRPPTRSPIRPPVSAAAGGDEGSSNKESEVLVVGERNAGRGIDSETGERGNRRTLHRPHGVK